MKYSSWCFLHLMTMISFYCIKAYFCVRCMFGSNSLNGVQLVPQGSPRWIGLLLDYIERWVFPVFKPTYGLSKALAVDYCFSPLYLNFSFKSPTPLKNLYFISPGRLSKCRGRFWPEPLEGWSQCKFQEARMAHCSIFPMIPHCLWATPSDLWLEGIFVPLLLQ